MKSDSEEPLNRTKTNDEIINDQPLEKEDVK